MVSAILLYWSIKIIHLELCQYSTQDNDHKNLWSLRLQAPQGEHFASGYIANFSRTVPTVEAD